MIDPTRLRPLDHLRLLEEIAENPEFEWLLTSLRCDFWGISLRGETQEQRENARQKYLAVDEVAAALQAAISNYRAEHEREMAEAKAAEGKAA